MGIYAGKHEQLISWGCFEMHYLTKPDWRMLAFMNLIFLVVFRMKTNTVNTSGK